MKIGILTHCVANNYGANLQALSTALYLKKHGYEPFFLLWNAYLCDRNKQMDVEQLNLHQSFLKNLGYEISEPCKTNEDFVEVIKHENIHNILVGSDAVFMVKSWIDRLRVAKKGLKLVPVSEEHKFPNPFWVPFAESLPECTFMYLSPSNQSISYRFLPKCVLQQMKKQMDYFSFFSARDTSTLNMIKYIKGISTTVRLTPDPVWGISNNGIKLPSKSEIVEKFDLTENYMVCSFYNTKLTSGWFDEFCRVAGADGVDVYALPMPQGCFESPLKQINLPISPIEWFSIIKYSRGYIGNNMHPIIVSMHNVVPFFSFDNHGKNILGLLQLEGTSKVFDLLRRFNMLDYRIKVSKSAKASPSYVYSKLKHFEYEKCQDVSKYMEIEYEKLMQDIISFFYDGKK